MTEEEKFAQEKRIELIGAAKEVVSVLEKLGVTQGEALVVFADAKAILHNQPVKLPDLNYTKDIYLGNYLDNYPNQSKGVFFSRAGSAR